MKYALLHKHNNTNGHFPGINQTTTRQPLNITRATYFTGQMIFLGE